ncbi:MAG TPA: RNA polymerase sigma factor [Dehalococcoidia bacterium]|nr:RNA polymerase sigma factor [Dehalococcoidia bacterium]
MTEGFVRVIPSDDKEDFEGWVAPYLGRMALIAARLGPPSDGDDVLQEALLRAWRHRASFDPKKGSVSGWLFTITANVARTRARRWRFLPFLETRREVSTDLDDRIDLERAIAQLSERQRLVIQCFYAIGLSIAETSQVMGCTEGTVKSTLADARSALRVKLDDAKERANYG